MRRSLRARSPSRGRRTLAPRRSGRCRIDWRRRSRPRTRPRSRPPPSPPTQPNSAMAWSALHGPGGCRVRVPLPSRGRRRPAPRWSGRCRSGRADDDVREPVPVHVPRGCHRAAEVRAGLIALRGPGGVAESPPPSRGRRTPAPRRSGRCRTAERPTMTSENPSPFTSPAVATERPNCELVWSDSAVQAGDVISGIDRDRIFGTGILDQDRELGPGEAELATGSPCHRHPRACSSP